jgi:hypothetical protein
MLKDLNKKIPKRPKKTQKTKSPTPTDPKEKILNE